MTEPQQPVKPTTYRYAVAYVIVDRFGGVLWTGSATINQSAPLPEDADQAAYFHSARTSKVIRTTTPPDAPDGRVIVTATYPI